MILNGLKLHNFRNYGDEPFSFDPAVNLILGENAQGKTNLLEAFRATGEDAVRLSVKGALSPIVLTPIEGDAFTYLVLPVRLKADA